MNTATASDTASTNSKIQAEITKLAYEAVKLHAESLKFQAETSKMHRERTWYPLALIAAAFTAGAALATALAKIFGA